MQKEDLKQIADLLDSKLEKSLVKNNKALKDSIVESVTEKVVNEVGVLLNQAFGEFEAKVNARFEAIESELALKPSISQFNTWADNNLAPVQSDVDKLKYVNREALKEVPSALEMGQTLIEEGLA
jgi:hypothetical protein